MCAASQIGRLSIFLGWPYAALPYMPGRDVTLRYNAPRPRQPARLRSRSNEALIEKVVSSLIEKVATSLIEKVES